MHRIGNLTHVAHVCVLQRYIEFRFARNVNHIEIAVILQICMRMSELHVCIFGTMVLNMLIRIPALYRYIHARQPICVQQQCAATRRDALTRARTPPMDDVHLNVNSKFS